MSNNIDTIRLLWMFAVLYYKSEVRDHLIEISAQDLKQGNLQKQSFLRYDKILLIEKARIMGVIAVVKRSFYGKVVQAICNFIRSK